MRIPGFTATVALDGPRRRYYQAVAGVVAGTQGAVRPARGPSGGGGVVTHPGLPVCPANPANPAPPGACPADASWPFPGKDTQWSCDYAGQRCACYGETDPSGCCDYFDAHCLNLSGGGGTAGGGGGGGGTVGGPVPRHALLV